MVFYSFVLEFPSLVFSSNWTTWCCDHHQNLTKSNVVQIAEMVMWCHKEIKLNVAAADCLSWWTPPHVMEEYESKGGTPKICLLSLSARWKGKAQYLSTHGVPKKHNPSLIMKILTPLGPNILMKFETPQSHTIHKSHIVNIML